MLTRLFTSLLLVAIFLPLFLFGGMATYLMVGIVCALSLYELTSMHAKNWPFGVRYLIIIGFVFLAYFPMELISWGVLLGSFLLIQLAVWSEKFKFEDAFLYSTLGLFVSLVGSSVLTLGVSSGVYLIYIAAVTFSVDTMAYFGGRFFGKHKFNPRISPKKTWEGFFSGLACGIIVSIVFSMIYPFVTNGVWGGLIIGIILSIGGQCGDLMFSLIKRNYNVKDFGSLLPGHGGLLDRIDSLIANIALFMVITKILEFFL